MVDYNPDTGLFIWKPRDISKFPTPRTGKIWNTKHAGTVAGSFPKDTYPKFRVFDKSYDMHRVVWLYNYGNFPVENIDHIDQDKQNNRIDNLRLATVSENGQNRIKPHGNNALGLLGVFRKRGKFAATICVKGKNKYLGQHPTKEKAYEAYLDAKKKYHTFWVTND